MLGITAGAYGPAGNYGATDLKPTGEWASGGSSGSFTYSYPIPVAPSVAGAAPSLAFEYDSGSVDGATIASNSQSSWVGRGWDLSTGFIERRYVSCNQDGHSDWDDLCWHSPYSTLPEQAAYVFSLGGSSTELILETGASPSGRVYRARDDNGWRFYRTTAGGDANPDVDHEAWRVESPDGTIYWFGKSSLAVSSPAGSPDRETNSVATVPVYVDADEPGATGWQTRAYRWMLDQVIDIHENSTSYVYELETNWYRRSTGSSSLYTAAVYPRTIYYGEPSDALMASPPARVSFVTTNRCINANDADPWADSTSCPTISATPSQYPDVPADLICSETCSSKQTTPSFFQRERLAYVLSQVKSTDGSGYDTVYRTQPRFAFPATDDGSASSLWLDWIQVRGYQGGDLRLPAVNFGGQQMRNRVDFTTTTGSGVLPLDKRRITKVQNGVGGAVLVDYNGPTYPHACPQTGSIANSSWYLNGVKDHWDSNDNLCYPVLFDPDGVGSQAAGFGIFHKYVVKAVTLHDEVGGSIDEVWTYDYLDAPAWAYHDDIISDIPDSKMPQTWDVFRGYHEVKTTHGGSLARSVTHTKYFDGLDGDHNANDTTDTSTYTYFDGDTVTNSRWLTGAVMESRALDENDLVLSQTKYTYTQQRFLDGPGWHNAVMRRGRTTYTKTRISEPNAPDTWRETQSTNYWTNDGLINRVNDSGELGVADNQCTDTSYARNVTSLTAATVRYIILPDDVVTYDSPTVCDDTDVAGDVTGHTTTYYDGSPDRIGNASVYDGNPTKTRVYTFAGTATSPSSSLYSYAGFDGRGRLTMTQTAAQEAAGKKTQVAYTTGASGYPTSITVTGPTGAASTLNVSRWQPNPNSVVDANGNYTWVDYDAFGRVTQVDKTAPGTAAASKGTRSLAQTFTKVSYPGDYAAGVVPTAPLKVTTTSLVKGSGAWPASGVTTTAVVQSARSFVDGFGRPRQTQVPSPAGDGGSVVTVSKYDSRGLLAATSAPTWFTNAPGTFIDDAGKTQFKSYTEFDYDNLQRPTATITYADGDEKYRTTTTHRGNRSVTTAPGGAKTATWFDARGRTTSTVQDLSVGTATTTYTYDVVPGVGTKVSVTSPPATNGGTASVTRFHTDLAGRRTKVEDSDAGTTTTTYNSVGQPVTLTTPTGTITSTFDVLDRPLTQTVKNTTGTTTGISSGTTVQANSWVYDTVAKGQLTSSSSATTNGVGGNATTVTTSKSVTGYDNLYRPTAQTQTVTLNPTTGLTSINNLAVTNQYTYDAAGNVLTATHPALGGLPAETVTAGYDSYGQPATLKTSTGNEWIVGATTWTGSGLFESRDYGTSTAAGAHRWISWDMVRRLPKRVRSGYGSTSAATATTSSTLWQDDTYDRDTDGNITSIIDRLNGTGGGQAQCFGYDDANRLTHASTIAAGTTTDSAGHPTAGNCPAALAALDTSTAWNAGTGAYRTIWTHGPSGAITSVKNYTITGGTGATPVATTRTYAYTNTADPGQLTAITPSLAGTSNSDTFTYDAAGAATIKATNTSGTTSAATLTMVTAPNGDLLSAINTGPTTTGGDSRYGYDDTGQRTARIVTTTSGTTTTKVATIYAGATELTLTGTGTATTLTGTRRYTLGGATVAVRVAAGGLKYLFDDTQGSNTLTVDATSSYSTTTGVTRQRYTPYGALRGQTALTLPTQHGWLDQTHDPDNGLTYLNNRYYDPTIGRFLAPDPLQVPDRPQDLNPYVYAGDNPLTYSDPGGLEHGEQTGEQCVISCGGTLEPISDPDRLKNRPKPVSVPPVPAPPGSSGGGRDEAIVFEGTVAPPSGKPAVVPVRAGPPWKIWNAQHDEAVWQTVLAIYLSPEYSAHGGGIVFTGRKFTGIPGAGPGGRYGFPDIVFVGLDGSTYVWEVKASGQAPTALSQLSRYQKAYPAANGGAQLQAGWSLPDVVSMSTSRAAVIRSYSPSQPGVRLYDATPRVRRPTYGVRGPNEAFLRIGAAVATALGVAFAAVASAPSGIVANS